MRKILLLVIIGVLSLNALNAQVSANRSDSIAVDPQKTDNEDSLRIGADEVLPKFQGGAWTDFGAWVTQQLKYPEDAYKQKVEGKVVIRFVVERDGTLGDIDILESPAEVFSREALRVVILSPKWTPGVSKGKNVRVTMVIPIRFKLDRRALAKQKRAIAKRSRQN